MSKDDKDSFKDRIIRSIGDQFKRAIVSGVRKGLMRILRIIIIAVVGAIAIAAGLVFLCLGIYNYLSLFLQPWISWLIMGFMAVLIGLVMLLIAYKSR